jgi:hypothetical protein
MSFAGNSNSSIPNPLEQARVLLEVCCDDLHDARAIAATNVKFARTEENILYWCQVEQQLNFEPRHLAVSNAAKQADPSKRSSAEALEKRSLSGRGEK